jgi:putative transferase (TIGR04331 family)
MGAWGPKDRISLRDSGLAGLGIALDENDEPVGDVIRRARLAIVTYNESLAPILISRDLPTVMLWNRRYVAASAAWQELSEILASAQMYFSDPVECARHVNEIADDVMGWWQSPIVRAARRRYCDDYARPLRRPGFTVGRTLRHALAPIPTHASAQRHG